MKTGLRLIVNNTFYARWKDDETGELFTQRKRLSQATKNNLSERDMEIITIAAKQNKIKAVKHLVNDGFTLREAIQYVRNLIPATVNKILEDQNA